MVFSTASISPAAFGAGDGEIWDVELAAPATLTMKTTLVRNNELARVEDHIPGFRIASERK